MAQVPHLFVPPLHPHLLCIPPSLPSPHPPSIIPCPLMSPHPTPLFPCPPSSSYLLWDTLTSSVTFQTPDVTKQSWKLRCPEGKKEGNVGTWGGKTVGMGATKGAGRGGEEEGGGGGWQWHSPLGRGLMSASPWGLELSDCPESVGETEVRSTAPPDRPCCPCVPPPPQKHSWDTPPCDIRVPTSPIPMGSPEVNIRCDLTCASPSPQGPPLYTVPHHLPLKDGPPLLSIPPPTPAPPPQRAWEPLRLLMGEPAFRGCSGSQAGL